jgi:hypothetical protein
MLARDMPLGSGDGGDDAGIDDRSRAVLAHELRNPLAALTSAGESLVRLAGADPLARAE